jgi:hypothetical protein
MKAIKLSALGNQFGEVLRCLPGRKGRTDRKAEDLTAICEPIVYKMWEPRRLTTPWAFTDCCRDSFTFFFFTLLRCSLCTEFLIFSRTCLWVA